MQKVYTVSIDLQLFLYLPHKKRRKVYISLENHVHFPSKLCYVVMPDPKGVGVYILRAAKVGRMRGAGLNPQHVLDQLWRVSLFAA